MLKVKPIVSYCSHALRRKHLSDALRPIMTAERSEYAPTQSVGAIKIFIFIIHLYVQHGLLPSLVKEGSGVVRFK